MLYWVEHCLVAYTGRVPPNLAGTVSGWARRKGKGTELEPCERYRIPTDTRDFGRAEIFGPVKRPSIVFSWTGDICEKLVVPDDYATSAASLLMQGRTGECGSAEMWLTAPYPSLVC